MTYTPSARAAVVTRRTYNRPLNIEGTEFETWEQTIDRVIMHQRWLWQTQLSRELNEAEDAELAELRELMLSRKALVAGRTLWLGGTDISRERAASMHNCSFTNVETVSDVVDVLWLLLQGCGVGFRPIVGSLTGFSTRIDNIEVIRSTRTDKLGAQGNRETWNATTKHWTLTIGDSAEAWAKFVGKLLAGKHPANKLTLDFSQIRPAGQRLRGYGWLSSGDAQIARATEAICGILNARAGSLLTRIDILDVVNWLGTVLSSRRSAEIALMSYGEQEWREFATAKHEFWIDNPQRAQSNNSLTFHTKPSRSEIAATIDMMIAAGGSEPGFINMEHAQQRAPWAVGVNPCVPAETLLLTRYGYAPIGTLRDQDVEVWNGEQWSATTVRSTGVNPLVRVTLSDGTHLDCTPYHTWILAGDVRTEARNLIGGDRLEKFAMPHVASVYGPTDTEAYSQGFYSGDGTRGRETSWVCEPKAAVKPYLIGRISMQLVQGRWRWAHGAMKDKAWVPLNDTTHYKLSWLAGLLDADGNVMRNRNSTSLCVASIDQQFLIDTRLMLTTLGVQAKVVVARAADNRNLPDGQGGSREYPTQESCRLLINATDTATLLVAGLSCKCLTIDLSAPNRDARRFVTVADVQSLDTEVETFCFTEPLAGRGTFNGIVTGQCAEILLANKGFCNLATVNVASFRKDHSGLHRALYMIARANYRQTCVDLKDGILQEAWHLNNQYLRLCGVSLTGIAQRPDLQPYDYRAMRRSATHGAYSMAKELGTPLPKNITTIKPEGTASKIMDATEGMHTPLGRYIFNNINFSRHDPLVAKARSAGYRVFDNPFSSDGVLITFPVKYDGVAFTKVNGVEVSIESAVSQLERYKMLMDNWCDQNVSATISYDVSERDAIVDWLDSNWNAYVGVSFLFRNDPTKTAKDLGYLYLPQEVVTKEVYDEYVKLLQPIDIDSSNSYDTVDVEDCAGGTCPVR